MQKPLVKDREAELLYFADVCAGPGGFSEYVLWRKKWHAKGFGMTLKGPNDFKLEDFYSASSELFEPYYGRDIEEEGTGGDERPSSVGTLGQRQLSTGHVCFTGSLSLGFPVHVVKVLVPSRLSLFTPTLVGCRLNTALGKTLIKTILNPLFFSCGDRR